MLNTDVQGISFVVRVRDEELTLEKSIRSLFSLTILHEIIVVLHLCHDNSLGIVKRLMKENCNIKLFEYDVEISRAGYQTLATDIDSAHSLMTYYTWCATKTIYPWTFKWDADFLASEKLIGFLNGFDWDVKDANYMIPCINDDAIQTEPYLVYNLKKYAKHIFWEVPLVSPVNLTLDKSICIFHMSSLSKIKKYWDARSWFEEEDTDEARMVLFRINRLNIDFGHELKGLARGCNPACDGVYVSIKQQPPTYVKLYN